MARVLTGFLFVLAVVAAGSAISSAGVPCAGSSYTSAEASSAPVGDTLEVYATVLDCYGVPVVGVYCYFLTDRGTQDVFIGNPALTNGSGFATARIVTEYAGSCLLSAQAANVPFGGTAIYWIGEEPSEPFLRVGEWMNPEAWHNWIGGIGGSTPIQLHIADPAGSIDSVRFYYSLDSSETWIYLSTDTDGSEPYLDTYGSALAEGDGWAAELDHDVIPTEIIQLDLRAIAYCPSGPIEATASRTYVPHPPSEVTFNVTDWDTAHAETLYLALNVGLVAVSEVDIYTEAKVDTFSKGIPKISQQSHSATHCAPTAAAACLEYFGGGVTGGLGGDALVDSLAAEMKTNQGVSGTTCGNWANGLRSWIARNGNGYTLRDHEHYTEAGGFDSGDWKRMRDELEACQDVLTAVFWPGGGGHAMTFNSIVNTPLPNGKIRVDWMDPWTGEYEYGELNTSTGEISNLSGAGGGGSGTIGKTMVVCPKEPTVQGPVKPGKIIVPWPHPGPIPIPIPFPPGPCHWIFLHIIVIDQYGNAYHFIIIVKYAPTAGVDDTQGALPATFNLSHSAPNPFSGATDIHYSVPVDARVDLAVYNVLGERVKTILSAQVTPGSHIATWDGTDEHGRIMAPGVYYARMTADGYEATLKMVLQR